MAGKLLFDPVTGELIQTAGDEPGVVRSPQTITNPVLAYQQGLRKVPPAPLALTPEGLLSALQHGNAARKELALRTISQHPSAFQSLRPAVVGMLASPEPTLRTRALETLQSLGWSSQCLRLIGEQLLQLYPQENQEICLELLSTLAQSTIPLVELSPVLLEIALSPKESCSARAAAILAAHGLSPQTVQNVGIQLLHGNPECKLGVLRLLTRCGKGAAAALHHVVLRLADADLAIREQAAQAFASIGFHPGAAAEINRILHHADPSLRLTMLHLLATHGFAARSIAPDILALVEDSDPAVAEEAHNTLLATGLGPESLSALQRLRSHPHWRLRAKAIALASLLDDASAMKLLVPILADKDSSLASEAEKCLIARGYHPEAAEILRTLLRTGQEVPKQHILNWLEHCGSSAREVGPVLAERLEDPQSEYAERATEVLMATGYHPGMQTVLRRCLRNSHQNRNLRALALCQHFGAEAHRLASDMVALLNSSNPIIQEAAIQALGNMPFQATLEKELTALLRSPRAETRASVFQTLQLMNVPLAKAAVLLQNGRHDRDAWVRSVAEDARDILTQRDSNVSH